MPRSNNPFEHVLKRLIKCQNYLKTHDTNTNYEIIVDLFLKLKLLDTTVEHLKKTGIAKTIKKYQNVSGDLGLHATSLINKWKQCVLRSSTLKRSHSDDDEDDGSQINGKRKRSENEILTPAQIKKEKVAKEHSVPESQHKSHSPPYTSPADQQYPVRIKREEDSQHRDTSKHSSNRDHSGSKDHKNHSKSSSKHKINVKKEASSPNAYKSRDEYRPSVKSETISGQDSYNPAKPSYDGRKAIKQEKMNIGYEEKLEYIPSKKIKIESTKKDEEYDPSKNSSISRDFIESYRTSCSSASNPDKADQYHQGDSGAGFENFDEATSTNAFQSAASYNPGQSAAKYSPDPQGDAYIPSKRFKHGSNNAASQSPLHEYRPVGAGGNKMAEGFGAGGTDNDDDVYNPASASNGYKNAGKDIKTEPYSSVRVKLERKDKDDEYDPTAYTRQGESPRYTTDDTYVPSRRETTTDEICDVKREVAGRSDSSLVNVSSRSNSAASKRDSKHSKSTRTDSLSRSSKHENSKNSRHNVNETHKSSRHEKSLNKEGSQSLIGKEKNVQINVKIEPSDYDSSLSCAKKSEKSSSSREHDSSKKNDEKSRNLHSDFKSSKHHSSNNTHKQNNSSSSKHHDTSSSKHHDTSSSKHHDTSSSKHHNSISSKTSDSSSSKHHSTKKSDKHHKETSRPKNNESKPSSKNHKSKSTKEEIKKVDSQSSSKKMESKIHSKDEYHQTKSHSSGKTIETDANIFSIMTNHKECSSSAKNSSKSKSKPKSNASKTSKESKSQDNPSTSKKHSKIYEQAESKDNDDDDDGTGWNSGEDCQNNTVSFGDLLSSFNVKPVKKKKTKLAFQKSVLNDISRKLLDDINPNYNPLPAILEKKKHTRPNLPDVDTTHKHVYERTMVYAGRRQCYVDKAPRLYDACLKVLSENLDAIECVGGVPFDILEPILKKCSAEQLFRIEEFNPTFVEDSDNLWKKFCETTFPKDKRMKRETYRDLYMRKFDDRQNKLKSLTKSIKKSMHVNSIPVRKTQLAFVDTSVKAPRTVLRAQMRHGTAGPMDRVDSLQRLSSHGGKKSFNSRNIVPVADSIGFEKIYKKKMAPMMAKTCKLIKSKNYRR